MLQRRVQTASSLNQRAHDISMKHKEAIDSLKDKNFERIVMKTSKIAQSQEFKKKRLEEQSEMLKSKNQSRLNNFKLASNDMTQRMQQKHDLINKKH